MPQQSIVASDGRLWTLPEFIRTPDEMAERDALLAGRFFLVRQGSLGELFRCSRCQMKHTYLSLMCVERPFSGVAEGLWAYYQTAGTPQARARLTQAERRRLDQVQRLLRPTAGLPDLAASHPQFARGLAVAEGDIEMGGVPLGILEEIPASLAQRFQSRINARGCRPKLALPTLLED